MRRHGRLSGGSSLAGKPVTPGSDALSPIRTYNSETNPSRPIRPSPLAASQIRGMPLDMIDRIRSFPLFQSTPDSFLAEIGAHLRPQVHAAYDYILTEGDEAKAMYWLVRGAVAVTSRDGESIYAELKPGAFFGEIGVLMDRPRTATIIARTRCLLVVLTKEDFKKILPSFPEVERAIRDEAEERLTITERKKRELGFAQSPPPDRLDFQSRKRVRDSITDILDADDDAGLDVNNISKKRKSPSPGLNPVPTSSALANGLVNVRMLLRELPVFADLPPDMLHFLGLNAQPRSYPPFTDIIRQDTPGREIFFIVRGEVEVLNERPSGSSKRRGTDAEGRRSVQVKARLKGGQYFGEVASLSLAPRRTATVRSVSFVESLMIPGEVLAEFWERCPAPIREQVESTAKRRLSSMYDGDVAMQDVTEPVLPVDELAIDEQFSTSPRRRSMPIVTEPRYDSPFKPSRLEDRPVMKPSDPDPYLNAGLDNVRSKSRRGSLAPITPDENCEIQPHPFSPIPGTAAQGSSKLLQHLGSVLPNAGAEVIRPARGSQQRPNTRGLFTEDILTAIFNHLDLYNLLCLRSVSHCWCDLISNSTDILHYLDLSLYNRKVTDDVLADVICPFVRDRPRVVDINNCFHITDEGFTSLTRMCSGNLRVLKMKSVWDVTASAIFEMTNKANALQEIDLSNCRKVSDTLLTRIVGWFTSSPVLGQQHLNGIGFQNVKWSKAGNTGSSEHKAPTSAGVVVGCPNLKRLTLSYCKHVTDRSMLHIASHAADRLEEVNLTRCTTISDQGFQYWGNAQFSRLRRLCLADCTYLTDNAIVYLTNAAKWLQELDLSFCCALSDTATEVLALGCPKLTHLNLSFCGSAVSDPSLRSIGLHLHDLQELSVRGCVRVTGIGVESVMEECNKIRVFDVSQCKNLTTWLQRGWHRRYGDRIRYQTVAENGRLVR